MRQFETGATRDTEEGKLDPEGFLSPVVVQRFSEYMHEHRMQADGTLRDSDNWQKGMPLDAYMKSAWRHFLDWWHHHRGTGQARDGLEDALCALLFNVQGYLLELLAEPLPKTGLTGWQGMEDTGHTFSPSGEVVPDKTWSEKQKEREEFFAEPKPKFWPESDWRPKTEPDFGPCSNPRFTFYDLGTWEMTQNEYESRRSSGLWEDREKAAQVLEHLERNGWARRVY